MKPLLKLMILFAILSVMGAYITTKALKTSPGIDFYQFWGVAQAQKGSNGTLKSPYPELSKYAALLDSYAVSSNDPRLQAANRSNHQLYHVGLDLTGTPLLYALFGIFPQDYSLSYVVFHATQMILFICAVVLLFAYKMEKWLWIVAISITIPYQWPVLINLNVGNLNAFQFFAIVALAFFCDRVITHCSARSAFIFGAVFMSFLVFLTLIKPNIIVITMLLALSLWALHGFRVFASSAVIAGLLGGGLLVIPCLYFDSWMVWNDWGLYLSDAARISYPVINGNYATTRILSNMLNTSVDMTMVIIVVTLAAHSLWVLLKQRQATESVKTYLHNCIVRLLRDPFLCASLGITLTLAFSPLVWWHYYILSLIPACWLIFVSPQRSLTQLLGVLSLILTSGHLPIVLGWQNLEPYPVACGWIPLWLGLQNVISNKCRESLVAEISWQ